MTCGKKKFFFSKALFYGYLRYGNHLQGMLRGLHDVFVEKISGVRNFFMCSKITFENYKIFKITTLFIWEKGYSSTLKRVSNFRAKYSSNIYTNHIFVPWKNINKLKSYTFFPKKLFSSFFPKIFQFFPFCGNFTIFVKFQLKVFSKKVWCNNQISEVYLSK